MVPTNEFANVFFVVPAAWLSGGAALRKARLVSRTGRAQRELSAPAFRRASVSVDRLGMRRNAGTAAAGVVKVTSFAGRGGTRYLAVLSSWPR